MHRRTPHRPPEKERAIAPPERITGTSWRGFGEITRTDGVWRKCVLAEELFILDANSELWPTVRPLLDVVLRLERDDDTYVWHGWSKKQIHQFLQRLPAHCTLVVGVWEMGAEDHTALAYESLVIGCVCEVIGGEVCTIRTFEALIDANLPSVKELEPGFEHAREIMRVVRTQVAPVAWALFTDKTTWDEWLFGDDDKGQAVDKGELLASFARQGRCVLMGSQTRHYCV